MKLRNFSVLALLSLSTALITGCAASFDPADSPPVSLSVGSISGTTYGGRQPISAARIYLYQTNTTAYAGPGLAASGSNASVSLMKSGGNTSFDGTNYYVTTSATGSFTITGDYNTCAAGSQVYLYATGGNPGAGTNTEAGLMAVLGACGSYSSSTTVNLNEVSTIAAAYAMAGFATDPTHVGAPSASNTVAATGIANAFANAAQLFDTSSSPYNVPNTTARTTTPGNGTNGGTGVPDYKKVNTLANILSSCINSTGTASTQCTTLFADMKSPSGATASDTAGIAIDMAQNSAALVGTTSNVTAVYNTTGVGGTDPYTPWYNTAAPNDFTVQISFTGSGLLASFTDYQDLVVDGPGNIWITSGQGVTPGSYGTILSGFNHLGVPLANGGYTSLGLNLPQGLAVDATSSFLYIANYADDNLIKFNLSTKALTSTFPMGSGVGPFGVALDSDGVPWVLDGNVDKAVKVDPSSGTISTTLTGNGLSGVQAITIKQGTHGDIWVSSAGGDGVSAFTYAGTAAGNNTAGATLQWSGINFDANNNVFSSLALGNGVGKILGSSISTFSWFPVDHGDFECELAFDGSNRLWLSNSDFQGTADPTKNAIFLVDSNTGNINNGTGYRPSPSNEPCDLAIDASGNIWFNSTNDNTLREMVGAATPVSVPLSYATANNKLGARP